MAERHASPLVIAKTHIPPRRTELLRRSRPVDQLYAHIEKQLVLIAAPAGYGKTSLLIDFAYEADIAVAWYRLDEFDNAPHTFLAYLIAAIRVPFPQFGASALAALERARDSVESLQPVITLMANELFSLPDHLVIVLDDYQVIGNEVVDQLLATLIRYAGENCHLFINSRTIPRIPDQAALLARGQMAGLSINELKFTASEIQSLFRQNYALNVPDQRARELAQATDGWITALLLMGLQAGWRALIEGAVSQPDAAGRVYDYLAEQIFAHQPSDVQRFLLGSAILDPLSPQLLDRLPGLSQSSAYLNTLHTQQLFVTRLGGHEEVYTYHPLFRDFLQARLRRDEPTWHEQLALACAQLYMEQRQWERVVEIYLSLGQNDEAARVLEAAEESLRSIPQVSNIAPWVEKLPQAISESRPHLLSLRGKRHFFRGRLEQALADFERAVRLFLEANDDASAADKLIWKGYALQGLGRYQQIITESRQVENLLTRPPERVRLRAMSLAQRGQAEFSLGAISDAYADLQHAKELAITSDDIVLQAGIAQNLGVAARAMGRLSEALENYSLALNLWERLQNPNAAAGLLNSLGYLYYLKGEFQEAEKILTDALSRARAAKALRHEALILSTLGDVCKDNGDHRKALEFFSDGLRVAQEAQYNYLSIYCQLAIGDIYRLMGDFARAHEWLQPALKTAQTSSSLVELGQARLACALLATDQGQLAEAATTFAEIADTFRNAGDKHLEALVEFYLAHTLHLQGQTAEAVPHLMRVAELLDLLGYDTFLVVAGRRAAITLKLASELDRTGLQFQRILERIRPLPLYPQASDVTPSATPMLAIHTLGQERFTVGDVEVPPLRPQVRELFLCLLARYPYGARREELGDLFWPNLSEARADGSLRVTLARIRKALCPIAFANGRYALVPERLWYDVHEFERGLSSAIRARSAPERIDHLQQAIGLYGGDYLTRLEADWVLTERTRLRKSYLNALMSLAQAYTEVEDFSSALQMYEKTSTEEPFLEEAWQGGMQTFARMGNRAAALAHYEQLKDILNKEMGIEPSVQSQSVYRKILNMRI